jgi:hypothetical protein
MVAEPHRFPQPQERTLRFFPPSSAGKSSCYSLPLPPGRYYLRLFSVYDNYDSKLRTPSFDVSAAATLVLSFRSPWPEPAARYGAYSDLIFPSATAPASDVCFYSLSTDAPVVASIEVAPVHPLAYDGATTGADLILHQGRRRLLAGVAGGCRFPEQRPQLRRHYCGREEDFRQQPAAQLLPHQAVRVGGHHGR